MKKLLLFCFLLFGINFAVKAQTTLETDTIKNFPYVCQADSFTVTVSCMHWSTVYLLDSVSHSYRNASLLINIYYSFQAGFGVLSPFKLPLRFVTPQPSRYTIYTKRFTNGIFIAQGTSQIGVCTTVSGIKQPDAETPGLKIYPNPALAYLQAELPESDIPAIIILTDLSGKMLFTKKIQPNQNTISLNIKQLPAGFYLLQYRSAEIMLTRKFLKL